MRFIERMRVGAASRDENRKRAPEQPGAVGRHEATGGYTQRQVPTLRLWMALPGPRWIIQPPVVLTKQWSYVQNYVHLGSPSAKNSLSTNELGT